MSRKTISEKLFEEFCQENGIALIPIERSDRSTPDYLLESAGIKILIEVKQFDPNDEERRAERMLEDSGVGPALGGEPGSKTRLKIQAAAKQFKSHNNDRHPTILVLYNNIPVSSRGVDPYEIKTAMYGLEKVDFAVSKSSVSIIDRGFGPKRKMTPTTNTSISAVAALIPKEETGLRLGRVNTNW